MLALWENPTSRFFVTAENVIFRHASTGVWVKEVREYVREYVLVREYVRARVREKSWWTLFGLTTKAGNNFITYDFLDRSDRVTI